MTNAESVVAAVTIFIVAIIACVDFFTSRKQREQTREKNSTAERCISEASDDELESMRSLNQELIMDAKINMFWGALEKYEADKALIEKEIAKRSERTPSNLLPMRYQRF